MWEWVRREDVVCGFRRRISFIIFQHVYSDTKLQLKIILLTNLDLYTLNCSLHNHYEIHRYYKYKLLHNRYTLLDYLFHFFRLLVTLSKNIFKSLPTTSYATYETKTA